MEIGLIGLGRMGASIAKRLLQANHAIVGFDSRVQKRFAHQVIAALRKQFGGHAVREG